MKNHDNLKKNDASGSRTKDTRCAAIKKSLYSILKYCLKRNDKIDTSLLGVHQLTFSLKFPHYHRWLVNLLGPMSILAWVAANSGMFTFPDTTTDFKCSFSSVIVSSATRKLVLQRLKRNKSKQTTKCQHLPVHIETLISETPLETYSFVWQIQICICISGICNSTVLLVLVTFLEQ